MLHCQEASEFETSQCQARDWFEVSSNELRIRCLDTFVPDDSRSGLSWRHSPCEMSSRSYKLTEAAARRGEEFPRGALLDQLASIEDEDPISIENAADALCNRDHGDAC